MPPSQITTPLGPLNTGREELLLPSGPVSLTRLECAALRVLSEQPDGYATETHLARSVWKQNAATRSHAVRIGMSRLIGKLDSYPEIARRLTRVRGTGWMLEGSSPLPPLFGRHALLTHLDGLLETQRFIVLRGPGGTGKTTLAKHLLAMHRTRSQHAIHVEVSTDGTESVCTKVSRVLGLANSNLDAVAEAMQSRGTFLLVLDGLEGLDEEEVRHTVASWLVANTDLSIVGCSRRWSDVEAVDVGPLDPEASRALLRWATRPANVDNGLDDAGLDAIAEACAWRPLFLAVAGRHLNVMTIHELLVELNGQRVGSPHEAVLDVMRWTLSLMCDEDRRALRALAQFQGCFTATEAQVLIGDVEPTTVMTRLLEWRLLDRVEDGLNMHRRVRSAIEALLALPEGAEELYVQTIRRWAVDAATTREATGLGGRLLGARAADLEEAYAQAKDPAGKTVLAIAMSYDVHRDPPDVIERLATPSRDGVDPVLYDWADSRRATLLLLSGSFEDGRQLFAELTERSEREGRAIPSLAIALRGAHDPLPADVDIAETTRLKQAGVFGAGPERAYAVACIGLSHAQVGRIPEGMAHLGIALQQLRDERQESLLAEALAFTASSWLRADQLDRAQELIDELASLDVVSEMPHHWCNQQYWRSVIALRRRERGALDIGLEGKAFAREHALGQWGARFSMQVGRVLLDFGRLAEAIETLYGSREQYRRYHGIIPATVSLEIATTQRMLGWYAQASATLRQMRPAAVEKGHSKIVSLIDLHRAGLRARTDTVSARARLDQTSRTAGTALAALVVHRHVEAYQLEHDTVERAAIAQEWDVDNAPRQTRHLIQCFLREGPDGG